MSAVCVCGVFMCMCARACVCVRCARAQVMTRHRVDAEATWAKYGMLSAEAAAAAASSSNGNRVGGGLGFRDST